MHILQVVCILVALGNFRMADAPTALPIAQQVSLPGHFDVPVVLEAARPLAKGFECRVRLPNGTLEEAVISPDEAATLAGASSTTRRRLNRSPERNSASNWRLACKTSSRPSESSVCCLTTYPSR